MWRQLLVSVALAASLLLLGACGDLAAALPARPTPVPTLARLPSVTPVTPSPTLPPATPTVATPTPALPIATAAITANVRAGPGRDFAVVGVLEAGVAVQLSSREGDWYAISAPGGVTGWMAGQVLNLPADAQQLPTATPEP